ncbi:hypothetical protein GM30_16765 [Trabulsiella odontotermitis]|nr:hypothetical protein GM30_16765 [Trabulsiella odontotermitis]
MAGSIVNTALLYAGNNLSLFANSIQNLHGDILAGNNLVMQKDASGTANAGVINTSGNIETTSGDITIKTNAFTNRYTTLQASENAEELAPLPSWVHGTEGDISLDDMGPNEVGYHYSLGSPHGDGFDRDIVWQVSVYERARFKEVLYSHSAVTVLAEGNQPRMSSGHNFSIYAYKLVNEAGLLLANNDFTLKGGELNDQSWQEGDKQQYLVFETTDPVSANDSEQNTKPHNTNTMSEYATLQKIHYKASGELKTQETPGKLYRAVIQAGGNIVADFTRDISNTNTTANAGKISNTITKPNLNTPSAQSIGGGGSSRRYGRQLSPALRQQRLLCAVHRSGQPLPHHREPQT